MKSIIVSLKHSDAVELFDADDNDIEEYTTALSKTLDNNNITILHATSGSLIVRPNEISSILITESEIEMNMEDSTSTMIFGDLDSDPPPEQVQEDIITD